jgi:putative tricarboxylic transport membrane protein
VSPPGLSLPFFCNVEVKNDMKKLDYMSGLGLFVFAAILLLAARRLPLMSEFGPGSGFFPVILSVLLACLSLLIVIQAWRKNRRVKTSEETPKILGPYKKKYFIYLALFFAFSLFLGSLGYFLSMVLFLGFILKYVEKQSWKTTCGVIILSGLVSYFLFIKFLAVPLPEGVLSLVF